MSFRDSRNLDLLYDLGRAGEERNPDTMVVFYFRNKVKVFIKYKEIKHGRTIN